MASKVTRMTLQEALQRRPEIDRTIVDATTDDDIRRHMIEDGEDPDAEPAAGRTWIEVQAAQVRARLGLSQPDFAELIHVPVATVRNWEQGRVTPAAAAKSLLAILWREPEAALRALRAA